MPDNSVLVLNFQKQKRESLKIRNYNSVYTEVENEQQKLLSDRSVLTEKNADLYGSLVSTRVRINS